MYFAEGMLQCFLNPENALLHSLSLLLAYPVTVASRRNARVGSESAAFRRSSPRGEIRSGGKSRWRRGLRLVLKLGLEVRFRVAQRLNLGYSEHSGIADNPESANLTNLRT